ncbi:MAG: hypothetical protein Q9178_007193 [Gyalolechia marmorata]
MPVYDQHGIDSSSSSGLLPEIVALRYKTCPTFVYETRVNNALYLRCDASVIRLVIRPRQAMTTPRSSDAFASPTSLGPSPMDDELYSEMLYRLWRDHLPPHRPFTLTSAIVPPPSDLCRYLSCPIQGVHAQGLFHYRGEPNRWTLQGLDFGASNPPPDIWLARDRLLNNNGLLGDHNKVHGFIHYHYVSRPASHQDLSEREYSPSVTSSADDDASMMELAEEMADVEIHASNTVDGAEDVPKHQAAGRPQSPTASSPPPPPPEDPTESENDAEIDQQLDLAFSEMELEEAQERAAQMTFTDEKVEAGITSQAVIKQDTTKPQPVKVALRDLVEVTYTDCVADREAAPEDGCDGYDDIQ